MGSSSEAKGHGKSLLLSSVPAEVSVNDLVAALSGLGLEGASAKEDGQGGESRDVTVTFATDPPEAALSRLSSAGELEVAGGRKVKAKLVAAEKVGGGGTTNGQGSVSSSSPAPPKNLFGDSQRVQQQRRSNPQHHGGFNSHHSAGVGGGGGRGGPPSGIDFPLRILVQSDMVGAIIGRGGQVRACHCHVLL